MRNVKSNVTLGMYALAVVALTTLSCKGDKKNAEDAGDHTEMENETDHDDEGMDMHEEDPMGSAGNMEIGTGQDAVTANQLIAHYLDIKDALVGDNTEGAATTGAMMVLSIKNFDMSPYPAEKKNKLSDIIKDAGEQAQGITKGDLAGQREYFVGLSRDMIALIEISGTERTLYQGYCPMANNNEGAAWLSAAREIRNPYFGSKMLRCGSIQKELN